MDFTQCKLTKSEWDGAEVPDSHEEQQIYQLIKEGYHDVGIVRNSSQTLLQYMKIAPSDEMHAHMYELYFKTHVDEMREAFGLSAFETDTDKKKLVKKADLIRIQNTNSNLEDQKTKKKNKKGGMRIRKNKSNKYGCKGKKSRKNGQNVSSKGCCGQPNWTL